MLDMGPSLLISFSPTMRYVDHMDQSLCNTVMLYALSAGSYIRIKQSGDTLKSQSVFIIEYELQLNCICLISGASKPQRQSLYYGPIVYWQLVWSIVGKQASKVYTGSCLVSLIKVMIIYIINYTRKQNFQFYKTSYT